MIKESLSPVVVIGEILFDIFPDGKRAGGAPFNFAFHLNSFGIPVKFITRIGADAEGEEILAILKDSGMDISHVQIDPNYPTGRVNIQLDDNGIPEFLIEQNTAYDFIEWNNDIDELLVTNLSMIYYGTLIQRSLTSFNTLKKFLNHKRTTPCFYDINLREGCYNEQAVINSLTNCNILKLNIDELNVLRTMLRGRKKNISFIQFLMDRYDIEWISLTKGGQGSALFTRGTISNSSITEQIEIVDTVGAGDAYASVLATGYLKHWRPEIILKKAEAFAASVCQIKGAVPEKNSEIYEKVLQR